MRIWLVFFMLLSVAGFSKEREDTLWSRNSIRMEIAGKSLLGFRFVYERTLLKRHPEKHPKAFTSIEAGISYPVGYLTNVMPGFGINRNWKVSQKDKVYFNIGMYAATLIALEPTPKNIRELYKDSVGIPTEVINPVEPWFFLDIGIKYVFNRAFLQLNITPFMFYDRVYNDRFYAYPWLGISMGFKLR